MAYRASAQRRDRDQDMRQRILACAQARVSKGGFAALTMQALADDVGIATGSLYRHFSGKGELAAQVFSTASRIEVDALGVILRGPGSPAASNSLPHAPGTAGAWPSP
jgi:AcrR family transcriptional regulator